jgi:uncharacterized protein
VQLLLEYRADVNVQDEGDNTPLILASGWARVEVIRLLIRHGADMHVQGEHGQTALGVATRR